MEPFNISAKNLSAFAMPNVDLASAWYLLRMDFHKLWEVFPSIFNDFDRRQKRFVRLHIDKYHRSPASFGEFADATRYLEVGRMKYWDPATNVTVTAIPDEVLELPNGKLAVVDFKSARFSSGQDKLRPLYHAQLSTYSWMVEKQGHGQVEKAGLIYFEPVMDESDESLLKCATKKGYDQPWITTPVPIKIDRKQPEALLKVVRKLRDMSVPPACNGNCHTDCSRIAELYQICRGVDLIRAEAAKGNQDGHYYRGINKRATRELKDALMELRGSSKEITTPSDFSLLDWWDRGSEPIEGEEE